MALMDAVSSAMSTIIQWIGVISAHLLTGSLRHLLPLFAIGVAISAILLGIKIVRSIVWGA